MIAPELLTEKDARIASLEAERSELEAERSELRAERSELQAELARLKRLIFGKRSEKIAPVNADQRRLFEEVDEAEPEAAQAPAAPAASTKPRAAPPGRNPLPSHFPVDVEIVAPGFDETAGKAVSAADLERPGHVLIGFEISRRVAYRAAEYRLIEQRRPKYRNLATGEITVALARDRVLARSIADETLATDIIVKKFLDHQPLYRQAEVLKRDHDWDLSRATMGKIVERVAVTLRPLYDALVKRVLATGYVQMDESGIRVLAGETPGAAHQGWMWLVRDPVSGAVAMRYDRGRSAAVPTAVLAEFSGLLQVDGYAAYGKALKTLAAEGRAIRQVGCAAHVRRKFFEARDADPRAEEALVLLGEMYALEAAWRGCAPDERRALRSATLRPLFDAFAAWLARYEYTALPKSAFGKAIAYGLKQWPTLAAVFDDGRVELDNNGIENRVRPLALGRKNYLFAGSHGAAENTAVLYSLLLSCRAAGVNPRNWLNDTLDRVLAHPVNRIEELLPVHFTG